MSTKIQTKFAIREKKIMENTLIKMGYQIDCKTGKLITRSKNTSCQIVIVDDEIQYDSMDKNEINQIKIEYSKSVAIADIESKGALYEIQETADEIIYLVKA